jgi:hypothetical protein
MAKTSIGIGSALLIEEDLWQRRAIDLHHSICIDVRIGRNPRGDKVRLDRVAGSGVRVHRRLPPDAAHRPHTAFRPSTASVILA